MSEYGYPQIVVTVRMLFPGYQAVVNLVKEPGNLRTIETLRECPHRHRKSRLARECGDRLAGRTR